MYLKSLTLRGFKSFASATTLVFEPGITCVVGPNGSGKSNVVDAIAWVMGEQGAKSLRGGKMEDVIFAGTSGRAPLGRAEVSLTIDNSDGALPIDYAEVTITRTMFRNGGSDYQINGDPCRLLDVQELLSDSGIGREMHVIVGQGRLDAILHASPEERRGFIEEAAGVLKHRKRKEKALRKLDAMSVNLTRLTDLTTELRRQLKPLGRQAELARRAQVIQSELRDARLRLLADDVVTLTDALAKEAADEAALREQQQQVEADLQSARNREHFLEDEVTREAPAQARAQETYVALAGQRERFAALRSVAAERVRNAADDQGGPVGPDPDELDREASAAAHQEQQLRAHLREQRDLLAAARTRRETAEAEVKEAEEATRNHQRAVADRSEGLERLRRQLAAAQSRMETRTAEITRLRAAHDEAVERAAASQRRFQEVESTITGLDVGEEGLDGAYADAEAAQAAADAEVAGLQHSIAEVQQQLTALAARIEALKLGLQGHDGSAALLAADAEVSGVLGKVASIVRVQPGYEVAVGAALGTLSDAVAVAGVADAAQAIAYLSREQRGRAHLLVAAPAPTDGPWPDLPAGARYAVDVVSPESASDDELRGALARVLRRVAIVDDLAAAQRLAAELDVVAVTRAGEVIAQGFAVGGHSESLLEVQAALSEAEGAHESAQHEWERLNFALASALDRQTAAAAAVAQVLEALHESDARMSAVAEELGALGSAVRAAQGEAERMLRAQSAAEAAAADDERTATELAVRLAEAESEPELTAPDPQRLPQLQEQLSQVRAAEVEVQLAVRTAEERQATAAAQVTQLETNAERVRRQRAAQAEARARRQREAEIGADVVTAVDYLLPLITAAVTRADEHRATLEQAKSARDGELRTLRGQIRELLDLADRLNDSVHRDEMAKAEQRMRIEAAQEKALTDFGIDAQTLVAEYGPGELIPPVAIAVADAEDVSADEAAQPVPYLREEQEARARKAERELQTLGRVNPLALEEFEAMQERQAFLSAQLEDLKKGRADLLGIIDDVDERVRQVFTEAYQDVAAQFEAVFSRLFPGGEGRLVLTDPEDMLATGVEVEARPPGKKIKRLSLLSGGERSLTAVAFLVALFKARPSPFYLLDEVEAALDDVNLGRLIGLLGELRDTSQLLVITHQKRTMEVADALYGVTMREGVTSVISQRLREAV